MSNLNRLRPWPNTHLSAKFHHCSLRIATVGCTQRLHGHPASQPASQRTDIAKSTQKTILSRSVYILVGLSQLVLGVTIFAQTYNTLFIIYDEGYNKFIAVLNFGDIFFHRPMDRDLPLLQWSQKCRKSKSKCYY